MLTELTFAILKYGFLVLLWIFVACTVRSLYRDIETLSPRKSRAHRRKERAARKAVESPAPVAAAAPSASAATNAKPTLLVIIDGPLAGSSVPLAGNTITLGRSASNTVVLDDADTARLHKWFHALPLPEPAPAPEHLLEVRGLGFGYTKGQSTLHDISFSIGKGEMVSIVGRNGAGKSTTMNMMTGYIGPTEGTILINGHDIVKEPAEAKRCIGYLPELPPLYTDMTVWEYLEFAAQLKNIPAKKRQESILNAMKMTGLVDVAKRLIKKLSKGYRQRVGFAQAVLGMPEIIILDEPTVGLDPIQIIEIRSLIKELAKEHTVILSSHILSEISAVCDEILIISHGRLVASDTTENLMHYMDSDAMLEISIRAPKEQAKNSFAQLHHVVAVLEATKQNEDDKHLNLTSFEIRTDGADVREAVFGICAEKNWPIYEMKYSKATLEDVFMELTADNKAHEEEMDEIKKSAEEAVKEAEQTKQANKEDDNESNI